MIDPYHPLVLSMQGTRPYFSAHTNALNWSVEIPPAIWLDIVSLPFIIMILIKLH